MDTQSVLTRYPTLFQVAGHGKLLSDLDAARKAAEQSANRKGLWELYWANGFAANELTFWTCIHEFGGWADHTGDEIEQNLAKIVREVGLNPAKAAYRKKLLVKNPSQFLDVRYEIATAAASIDFFDNKTLTLEQGIGGAARNSDVKGMRNGRPVRMEVRVVHDSWPPPVDPTAEDVIRGTNVPLGFAVSLRFPIDAAGADLVKTTIETLHARSAGGYVSEREPITVENHDFWYEGITESFSSGDENCPVVSVGFEPDPNVRIVTPPVYTRSTVDPQERDYFKNPKGVYVFSGDLADKRTYEDRPLSTRIGQAVQSKVRQCEAGACNVVVLGTPSPLVDNEVGDALLGPIAATYAKGPDGFQSSGWIRKPSGMFVPAQYSENQANLVDPYRIISAVWHIRLGVSAPQSRVILNPNATVPFAQTDAASLANTLPRRK